MSPTVDQLIAEVRRMLAELKRIRVATERPSVEPAYVDYATAARMLCTSKRSIERLISDKRLRAFDIAGPKLRVADLRNLGEPPRATARQKKSATATALQQVRRAGTLMQRVRELALEGEPHE